MADKDALSEHLDQIDAKIRGGEIGPARSKLLRLIKTRTIVRPLRARTAQLCRRSDLNPEALRILGRWVRPSSSGNIFAAHASDAEKGEYAAALANLGAAREALDILKSVDTKNYPVAFLYSAYAYMSQWEYAKALPLLRSYVSSDQVLEYQRLVGEVNLAAVLVHEKIHTEAEALLKKLIRSAQDNKRQLLLANLLEIQTQLWIQRGEVARALETISESRKLIDSASNSSASVYIDKWQAVAELMQASKSARRAQALTQVQAKAHAMGAWETVRDCDLQIARLTESQEHLEYLYAGSPYPAYRDLIEAVARETFELRDFPPSSYIWIPSQDRAFARAARRIWDTRTGNWNDKTEFKLKPGQLPQRLLLTLCRDFYRPWRIASLFSELFPGQHFNIDSSPGVVHQALNRLRTWLASEKMPLKLDFSDGAYALRTSKNDFGLRLDLALEGKAQAPQSRTQILCRQLSEVFGDAPFTSSEVAELLRSTERTARRYLADAVTEGDLTKEARGNKTTYRLSGVAASLKRA